jgi:hypothetical protein
MKISRGDGKGRNRQLIATVINVTYAFCLFSPEGANKMDLIRQHRKAFIQILALVIGLSLIYAAAHRLPGPFQTGLQWIAILIGILFLGLALTFLALQIIFNFRFERSFHPEKLKIRPLPALEKYRIINSLDAPGTFKKAQLHAHSSLSYDSDTDAADLVNSYKNDGYSFLCVTDHDRISAFAHLSDDSLRVIPGIEVTIPVLFWPIPLGKHLVVINPALDSSHAALEAARSDPEGIADRVVVPAHPGWRGGAGTGRWFPEDLATMKGLRFIEIESPHSRDPVDLTLWNLINVQHGPEDPVWGVAVDDAHDGSRNSGWIMVKTTDLSLGAFMNALKKGAFYPTRGPLLDITVTGRSVEVKSPAAKWIRFIDCQNRIVAVFRSDTATYESRGDEGFIRVEAEDPRGRTAWSQPMWLVAD